MNDIIIQTNLNDKKVLIYNIVTKRKLRISQNAYNILLDIHSEILNSGKDLNDETINAYTLMYDNLALKKLLSNVNEIGFFNKKKIDFNITIQLTNLCNLECKHCCAEAEVSNNYHTDYAEDIIISRLEKIIELNPRQITLTGGEPLILPFFKKVIKYIKQNSNADILLATNGTLINDSNAEFLSRNIDFFDISLDGYDVDSVNKIRGKGVFDLVIKNIEILKINGVKDITLSYALDFFDDIKHEVEKFESMCNRLGVTPILRQLESVGRGKSNFLNIEANKMSKVISVYKSDRIEYSPSKCKGGISDFFVNSNGDVYQCFGIQDKKYAISNIDDVSSFFDIIEQFNIENINVRSFNHDLYKYFDDCDECEVNIFCIGCPLKVYNDKRKFNKSELQELCKIKKKKIYEEIWN